MTHAQAFEHVAQLGGTATEYVTRQTTMLVVNAESSTLEDDGSAPLKLRQARQWQQAGTGLRLLTEADWLVILGRGDFRDRPLYTPSTLSAMLGLPVAVIRRWERLGLIRPAQRVFRLPFFDLQEVASARRLSELLHTGISRAKLEESLRQLPSVQRGDQRPLEQLEILCVGGELALRDQYGLIAPISQQRFFSFDEPKTTVTNDPAAPDEDFNNAESWFDRGAASFEKDDLKTAEQCFRKSLMIDGHRPETHVRLAECLYRQGNPQGARERYSAAIEHDHNDLEAWTQLGCLHRELGDVPAAEVAFRSALNIHPNFPDALLHLAELLREIGRIAEAVPLWKQYLVADSHGPWADNVRQSLEAAV